MKIGVISVGHKQKSFEQMTFFLEQQASTERQKNTLDDVYSRSILSFFFKKCYFFAIEFFECFKLTTK